MTNIAYIYQPHFKTSKFRVACKSQQGEQFNYIVVTCSPEFNGIYKYGANNVKNYEIWNNNHTSCLCVPINDCVKLKSLEEVTNTEVIAKIKQQQSDWYTNNVCNRDYSYANKPDWMLK